MQLSADERRAYQLGRRHFELGDPALAHSELSRLVESRPRFADVHYMLGVVCERQGDLDAASSRFERALAINADYTEARIALASVLEQRGEFARARALVGQPSEPVLGVVDGVTRAKLANLQAALGDAYREAGEQDDAVEAYRKALDRCPQYHDVRARLGVALREKGLPQQAIRELERVLRANPSFVEARVELGLTFHSLGQAQRAREQWLAALGSDPGCEEARRYLRLLTPAEDADEPGGEDQVRGEAKRT